MQICFIHDLFRSGYGTGDAGRNGAWLHALLAPTLAALGHTVRRLDAAEPSAASPLPEAGPAWAAGEAQAAWARTFSDPACLDRVAQAHAALRPGAFVIGHELTPNQIRHFAASGVRFLDIRIDPIRFAPDLFLRMRTNDAGMLRTLEAHAIPCAALRPHAASLRAAGAPGRGEDPAVLFVGQTDLDGSLVCGARLASVAPFLDAIGRMLDGRRLLLKPHPYGREHRSILALRAAFAGARVVNDPIYALINAPYVEEVVTLSSGVAQEARLCGTPARALITPDNARERVGAGLVSADYRIGVESLGPAFWASLGEGAAPGRAPRPRGVQRGALRRAVGQAWGYVPAPRLSQRRVFHGQALSFAAGGHGLDLCTLGWSRAERSGVWSDGTLATLLVDPQGERLDLALDCAGFVPQGEPPLQVQVGVGVARRCVTFQGRGSRRLVIALPASEDPVEIVFEIAGARRPVDAGRGADRRRLGVRLIRGLVSRPQAERGSFGIIPVRQRLGYGMRAAASLAAAVIGLG